MHFILMAVTAVSSPVPGTVQVPVPAPVAVTSPIPVVIEAPRGVLPANSEIAVTPVSDLTSKGIKVGHIVPITTVYDVMHNGYVVIPKGTLGQAEVTWRTGKGAFGKSAKIDLSYQWLDLNGRKIALSGKHRQNGEGNTGAAVGAWVAAGVIGGALVTGKSAKLPAGTPLIARTAEGLPYLLPANAVQVPMAAIGPAPIAATPSTPTPPSGSAPLPQ